MLGTHGYHSRTERIKEPISAPGRRQEKNGIAPNITVGNAVFGDTDEPETPVEAVSTVRESRNTRIFYMVKQ